MSAVISPPAASAAGPAAEPGRSVLLEDIPWPAYEAIGAALRGRANVRLTFDRGRLEVMTLSHPHEWLKQLLGRLFETIAEEAGLVIQVGGQMTFRNEELDRGFEPDQCYWIAHEAAMRVPHEWRPDRDPAPDLILEIEVTRSALNRMGVFAAYGVPEVWRFDGQALHVHLLQPDGTYAAADRSPAIPTVPIADVAAFLGFDPSRDYLSVIRTFRAWVRGHLGRP